MRAYTVLPPAPRITQSAARRSKISTNLSILAPELHREPQAKPILFTSTSMSLCCVVIKQNRMLIKLYVRFFCRLVVFLPLCSYYFFYLYSYLFFTSIFQYYHKH